jgi:hypothetical protein
MKRGKGRTDIQKLVTAELDPFVSYFCVNRRNKNHTKPLRIIVIYPYFLNLL